LQAFGPISAGAPCCLNELRVSVKQPKQSQILDCSSETPKREQDAVLRKFNAPNEEERIADAIICGTGRAALADAGRDSCKGTAGAIGAAGSRVYFRLMAV
jgi:hypothetical protein